MTSRAVALISVIAALALCGCEPQPAQEDEIQKTMRMVEEARRGRKPGRSGNVYISVERVQVSASEAAGLATLWRYARGRVTVGGGGGLARGGLRLGMAGNDFAARLSAYARSARSLRRTTSEITVLSGYEGRLEVGRSVVVPVLRFVGSSGRAVVLERATLGTALTVRPRVLNDGSIELDLAPHFTVLGGGRARNTYAVSSMRSRVVVRPGQKLVIGASSSAKQGSVGAGLFGFDSSGRKSATLITVKAMQL
jgi:type II secretory pathway component GspD/PulD (secretin)